MVAVRLPILSTVSRKQSHLPSDGSCCLLSALPAGSGYICLGTMVMLAQKDEGHLVKLAMPCVPMTDDYCNSDPAAMTKANWLELGMASFLIYDWVFNLSKPIILH